MADQSFEGVPNPVDDGLPGLLAAMSKVADLKGVVHWLNASDGRFVSRVKVGDRVSMAPVASGSLALITDDKGQVTAFRARSTVTAAKPPAEPTKPTG